MLHHDTLGLLCQMTSVIVTYKDDGDGDDGSHGSDRNQWTIVSWE